MVIYCNSTGVWWESFWLNMSSWPRDQISIDSTKNSTNFVKTLTKSWTPRTSKRSTSCWRSTSYTSKSISNPTLLCMRADHTLTFGASTSFTVQKPSPLIRLDITRRTYSFTQNPLLFISMNSTHIWPLLGSMITSIWVRISTTTTWKVNIWTIKRDLTQVLTLSSNNLMMLTDNHDEEKIVTNNDLSFYSLQDRFEDHERYRLVMNQQWMKWQMIFKLHIIT